MTDNSSPSQPLDVSIVGAGIGGLAAAIALRRNGHHIFESAEVKAEIGAAIVVPVNAQRVLEHFGYEKANLQSVNFVGVQNFNSTESGSSRTAPWMEIEGKVALMCVRSELHGELERLATGPGEGPPAVIHLASQVVNCNPEDASLTLGDGRVIEGDLVLGADGISSTIRTHVLGYEQKSVRTGLTNSRTLLDMSALDAIPELAWLREGVSGPRNIIEFRQRFRVLFLYPCRGGTLMNFLAGVEDPHQADPDWIPSSSREDLLAEFSDYHPQFQALLKMLPERLPRWQLRFLPVLPTWVCGRAALVGDAAHATLPTLGQGAAQAVEDAGALGVLLPAGTTRADIPARLKAYEALRKERAELIARESHDQMMVPSERGKYFRAPELQKYAMGYDVLTAARKVCEEQFAGGK
ncbi:FAD/NAD(P)-binding domain-containing protein [Mycena venus]|uniref:FAD/NAD(P)-binding domain-containing protein n=1 Tax=Mycena venus TaxID=2733690 RepID=A0A8H6Y110_9AGAR|nr:FAD/NAD(P)-binding domain-containing protein [Mycena venus]